MIKKAILLSLMGCSLLFCSEELETAIEKLDVDRVEQILDQKDQKFKELYLVGLADHLNWRIRDYVEKCQSRCLLGLFGGIAAGLAGGCLLADYVPQGGAGPLLILGLSFVGGVTAGHWLANLSCPNFNPGKARSIIYLLLRRLSPEQRACAKTSGFLAEEKNIPIVVNAPIVVPARRAS